MSTVRETEREMYVREREREREGQREGEREEGMGEREIAHTMIMWQTIRSRQCLSPPRIFVRSEKRP